MTIDRTKLRWNGWGWAAHKDEVAAREDVWMWLADELGMPALLATPAQPLEDSEIPPSRLDEDARTQLKAIVGEERVHEDAFQRAFHARGRSYHDLLRLRAGDFSAMPDAVVYPRSADEVLALLSFASAVGIAVVPYGGGTSVVGGVTAAAGAKRAVTTLDLSGLDRLIEVDALNQTATAEAGIYGPVLEKALESKGLTLGHLPQSFEFSTLGGWIAHRGAGQGSNGFGRAEDWLVSARLATPRGFLSTNAAPSSSAGPRLKDIVLGSEGAFGIVTEATVRVRSRPAVQDYRGFLFRDFDSGTAAIRKAVQEGLSVTMLRLSDAEETRFYRAFARAGRSDGLFDHATRLYLEARSFDAKMCALIAGFEGDAETVAASRKEFGKIASALGALSLGKRQGQSWREGRFHGPYLRDPMMDRGVGVDTLETATSWSKLDALYRAVRGTLEAAMAETAPRAGAHGIVLTHISHAYPDGASLYFTCIFPRALGGEVAQWSRIKNAATDAVLAGGGTLSHHHGVGEDHLPWMAQEKSALGLDVLRAIKRTLDPEGILNPGKLIPG